MVVITPMAHLVPKIAQAIPQFAPALVAAAVSVCASRGSRGVTNRCEYGNTLALSQCLQPGTMVVSTPMAHLVPKIAHAIPQFAPALVAAAVSVRPSKVK